MQYTHMAKSFSDSFEKPFRYGRFDCLGLQFMIKEDSNSAYIRFENADADHISKFELEGYAISSSEVFDSL